jgi:hypothetical protein
MALYHGFFAIKILVKNLGLLRERMYCVKSDRNKRRYISTLPLCLKWVSPHRTVEYFHKNRQAENSGVEVSDKRDSSEGHETECLYEMQNRTAGLPSRRGPSWGFFPAEACSIDSTAGM